MANTAMPNAAMRGAAQSQTQATLVDARKIVQQRAAERGAKWFYWIAALSVINSVIMLNGSNTHFVVGLGVTEMFDVAGRSLHGAGQSMALVMSLGIAGLFGIFGYFASKMQQWSFLIGMVLYGLDAVLLLSFRDMPSAGFHGLALYFLFRGYAASRNYTSIRPANAPIG